MTDVDLATERRDIADALLTALDRRHEVLDAIVDTVWPATAASNPLTR